MWGLIWLWKGFNQEGEGINAGDGWPWSIPLTNKIEKFLTFYFKGQMSIYFLHQLVTMGSLYFQFLNFLPPKVNDTTT
jgi:hypothetical protein